jgi:ParB-like chromosome segregation protein Spo0J
MDDKELAAEWVDIRKLKPWVKNPRKNDHVVDKIADSIKRFGFGAPLVARKENGELIAGHTRLKAAIKLGLKEVPVRYLDISEKDAHLLALADNRLGEFAEWDVVMIRDILQNTMASDVDLLGFDERLLEQIMTASQQEIATHNTEIDVKNMKFGHVCPKCKFEF